MEWFRLLGWVEILKGALLIFGGLLSLLCLLLLLKALWVAVLHLGRERGRTALAIFLLLVSALLFLSLITYSKEDTERLDTGMLRNLGGISGVLASTWLYRVFGLSCYFLPVLLSLAGVQLLRRGDPGRILSLSALITGIAIFASLLLSLLPLAQLSEGYRNGGLVGYRPINFLRRYSGEPGAYLISIFFLFVVLTLFTRLSLRPLGRIPSTVMEKMRTRSARRREERARIEDLRVQAEEVRAEEPRDLSRPVEETPTPPPPVRLPTRKLTGGIDTEFQEQFIQFLESPPQVRPVEDKEELRKNSEILEEKLKDFKILGRIMDVAPGPVVTRYAFEPAPGIRVSSIASVADDLALATKSSRIRIEAPIPGKAAVGIEVPNRERAFVYLKEILSSKEFSSSTSKLTVALGKDIAGQPDCADIAWMPHLLIAGATGSGKSVCINTMVASILYRAEPRDVRFIMVDPKMLELPVYNGIPHLLKPVITNAKESLETLKEVVGLMEIRYQEFARAGVRDIEGYNEKMESKKPYVLVIVDELADLMITAPGEIEAILTRLAQMSRAVGIHLVLATQRPSVDVITGLIKANFPARIAFQVASGTDSRTILDMSGAEKLLGRGDMLFLPPGKGTPVRLHGAYISTEEAKRVANLWASVHLNQLLQGEIEEPDKVVGKILGEDLVDSIVASHKTPGSKERLRRFSQEIEDELSIPSEELYSVLTGLAYYPSISEELVQAEVAPRAEERGGEAEELDELFEEAKRLVTRHQVASVSLLQRRLKIGYARAGRLIDQLEKAGVIGPFVGSKSREVLTQEL